MTSTILGSHSTALDLKEVWYSNMHLLGFKPALCEDKYKVAFEKDMFIHINKRGSEVVLHFLFSKIDSHLAYEEFRDCWPVYDKKQEQQFRKACSNWLTRIAKEEPGSKLPLMSASLLLSPGGNKFYLFLLRFSSYVLRFTCMNEAASVEKNLFLSSFVTCSRGFGGINSRLSEVTHSAMQSHIVKHFNAIQQRAQLVCALHREWETYASRLTDEYRWLSRESRCLTKKLLSLEDEQKQRSLARTPQSQSVIGSQATNNRVLALTTEIMEKQRNPRLGKTREMWRILEKFVDSSEYQREVVDSIVQGESDQYTINAKDFTFQIPEMVLEEYRSLDREGKAANTYHAGRLNLICLIQMWRCSLRLLKSQLLQDGLPTFDKELSFTSTELQAHRAHLSAATNLRASLSALRISLEESIEKLESELKQHRDTHLPVKGGISKDANLPQLFVPDITIPSLDLDLLPPSPVKTETHKTPDLRADELPHLSLLAHDVSTPDAIRNISLSIQQASHLRCQKLPRQSSRIPVTAKMKAGSKSLMSKDHDRYSSVGSDGQKDDSLNFSLAGRDEQSTRSRLKDNKTDPSLKVNPSVSGVKETTTDQSFTVNSFISGIMNTSTISSPHLKVVAATPHLNRTDANTAIPHLNRTGDNTAIPHLNRTGDNTGTPHLNRTGDNTGTPHLNRTDDYTAIPCLNGTDSNTPASSYCLKGAGSTVSTPLSPQLEGTNSTTSTPIGSNIILGTDRGNLQLKGTPYAHDILADQIAAAVVANDESFLSDGVSPNQLHSVVNTVSAMGKDAFHSRDLIQRTPLLSNREPTTMQTSRRTTDANHTLLSGSLDTFDKEDGESLEESASEDHNSLQAYPNATLQSTYVITNGKNSMVRTLFDSFGGDLGQHSHTLSGHEHTVALSGEESLFVLATPKLTGGSQSRDSNTTKVVTIQETFLPSPFKVDGCITPMQSMSFLRDIQPPTPFQHTEFDLDSSDNSSEDEKALVTQSEEDNSKCRSNSRERVHNLDSILVDDRSVNHHHHNSFSGHILSIEDENKPKVGTLLDLTTPRGRNGSPSTANTVYDSKYQQQFGEETSLPAYLYPSTSSADSGPGHTHSSHNPWLADRNSTELFDAGSPELVSGSESPELSFSHGNSTFSNV